MNFWAAQLRQAAAWALATLPRLLLLVVLTYVALRLLRVGLSRLQTRLVVGSQTRDSAAGAEYEKRTETLIGIARKVGAIAIGGMFAMLVLVELGINVGPLIAGAGILGLAVGFGAQELVRDVISGFFMLVENHVRQGDVAILNGTGGLVEKIGLRTIALRDLSGVVHVFQNGKIDTLSNMTKGWSAMVFEVGVAYKEDPDHAIEVMREVARELHEDPDFRAKIIEPMEMFGVESFGDSAVVIKARLKTLPIEQWSVGREYRRRLKHAFDRAGIEIPFPHRTLYWGEESPPLQAVVCRSGAAPERDERGPAAPISNREP